MPEVLVTGATGRIGAVMRRILPAASAFSRTGAGGTRRLDLRVASAAGELLRSRPDLVVNCAALSTGGACRADPASAFALNMLWPARLAFACHRAGARLVHVSTDLVYSGATPPYRESSPAVPKSLYGWTKLLGDRLLLLRHPEALVARTSVVFGPSPSASPTFSEAILDGRVPAFYTDSWRNHTPVGWLAGTLLSLADSDACGLMLVCARWEQTRSAFAEALLRHLGRDADGLPTAYRPSGVPESLALRPSLMEQAIGEDAPGLHRALELEYPVG